MTALDVKIIGGGIGGVAASVALTLAGCKVTILEAAPEIGEVRMLDHCSVPFSDSMRGVTLRLDFTTESLLLRHALVADLDHFPLAHF